MTRFALALGAGGITGHAFHCGVMAAVEDALGIEVTDAEAIVGTSAGSIVAALIRAGMRGSDLAARACGEPPSERVRALVERIGPPATALDRSDGPVNLRPAALAALGQMMRRPWQTRVGGVGAALLPEGRVSTESISGPIQEVLGAGGWLPGLQIPAVHLESGRRVVFDGSDPGGPDLGVAAAASCAIPGWFTPVIINGERYVDGGLWSPTNADLLADSGVDLVIVSSPMSSGVRESFRRLDAPARVLHKGYLSYERRVLERGGAEVLVFEPDAEILGHMGANAMDPTSRADVTRTVRRAVRAALE